MGASEWDSSHSFSFTEPAAPAKVNPLAGAAGSNSEGWS
jgi:hypothetical protein